MDQIRKKSFSYRTLNCFLLSVKVLPVGAGKCCSIRFSAVVVVDPKISSFMVSPTACPVSRSRTAEDIIEVLV